MRAASVTGFYVSTNALLDAADVRMGSRTTPALAPGASSARTTTVTLPAVSAGTWYLLVNADDDRTVTETQETNNTRAVTILVGPDLNVATFTAPFSVVAGSTITVSDSVKNIGAADAGASVIGFYLSPDMLLSTNDQLLGSQERSSAGRGPDQQQLDLDRDPRRAVGDVYLFAVADGTSAVAEASEGNNTFLRIIQITR